MQESNFAHGRIFKLVPSWDKNIIALADYDKKLRHFSKINDLYIKHNNDFPFDFYDIKGSYIQTPFAIQDSLQRQVYVIF